MSSSEKRVYHRIRTDVIGQLDVTGDDGADLPSFAVICNLSEGGAFLETVHLIELGTRLRLTFDLPRNAGIFTVEAAVCRHETGEPRGVGLQFDGVTEEQRASLRDLIADRNSESAT